MKRVDYDACLYKTYQEGRALSEDTARLWMKAVGKYLPRRSGLVILDLGCGTGRFSGLLAEHCHARVIGVDPSSKMLSIARENAGDAAISYLEGCAESIPVGDEECDAAFLSMVVHHVDDFPRCCRELRRVLRPLGRAIVRNAFRDRLSSVRSFEFWPTARALEERRLPSINEVVDAFLAGGFSKTAHEVVTQQIDVSLRDHLERMKKKAISVFELISDEEFRAGLAAMEKAVQRESRPSPVMDEIDLLVFEKTATAA